ncbi:MAG: DAK2 domain-containing protein [Candidatus Nanopelagicales bacterium]
MTARVDLDCTTIQEWAYAALDGLEDARARIDSLNVFPVPDGDTGTNVYLTMEAACTAVDAAIADSRSRAGAAAALARGALLGARGNSGVIMSQILKGTGDVLGDLPDDHPVDGPAIARLLRRGADLAYAAVARPVEGTILTVARAAADAAQEAVDAGVTDTSQVLARAAENARQALDRTPELLETLRLAGVVDAGGQALVVVLDALAEVVEGVRRPRSIAPRAVVQPIEDRREVDYTGPAYEVMFLLDAEESAISGLRTSLDALGDSLVIVGGERLWNVHVHVDDAGAAVEAGIAAGHPYRLRITYLHTDEHVDEVGLRSVVAVAHGTGIAELLREQGVHVVAAKPAQRPSTSEILESIVNAHSGEVIVLPSDGDTRAVAEIAATQARADGIRVSVIPTRSVVQTLAAVAVSDPEARFDDDVVSMTRAAGATHYGAITTSVREALTSAGTCRPGDILGLVDGDIRFIGHEADATARELIVSMLAAGAELLTLVCGEGASEYMRTVLPRWLATEYQLVDVVTHEGGQPLWPLIIGVE